MTFTSEDYSRFQKMLRFFMVQADSARNRTEAAHPYKFPEDGPQFLEAYGVQPALFEYGDLSFGVQFADGKEFGTPETTFLYTMNKRVVIRPVYEGVAVDARVASLTAEPADGVDTQHLPQPYTMTASVADLGLDEPSDESGEPTETLKKMLDLIATIAE